MFKTSHLEALSAVCESGSFEIAASMLGITQSALSQRIGALEREAGLVLVERSRPVEPTRPGRIVLGLARQVMLLSSDAQRLLAADSSLPDASGMARVSLAINADSISTWFQPVIARIAAERSLLLDLHVEDQDHTAALLREGCVMAAVTTSSAPAPGCTVERLGTMVYRPVCAPSLIKGLEKEEVDLGRLPMLRFDTKDASSTPTCGRPRWRTSRLSTTSHRTVSSSWLSDSGSDGVYSQRARSPETSRPAGWSSCIRIAACRCRCTGSDGSSIPRPSAR